MGRVKAQLSPKTIEALKLPVGKRSARFAVGGADGLYLRIVGSQRSWLFRYMLKGKATDMIVGRYAPNADTKDRAGGMTFEDAKLHVLSLRKAMREEGIDPLADRRAIERAKAEAERSAKNPEKPVTFGDCAEKTIVNRTAELKNKKSRDQWRNTLTTYCKPLWNDPVAAITRAQVAAVLEPIWGSKPETARRLRTRIEAVFNHAKSAEYRTDNPAEYKGVLDGLLVRPSKMRKPKSFKSLPYREIAAFVASLRKREGIAAQALEFTILCASRSGEVRGMVWSEVEDLDGAAPLWRIPGERMKMGEPHTVPLTPRAVAILKDRRSKRIVGTDLVFPGTSNAAMSDMTLSAVLKRMKLNVTVHGFRSSFKDFCANESEAADEISEEALAHRVGAKIRRHYRHEEALEKRRKLLVEWQTWCETTRNTVVSIEKAA